MKKEDIKEFFKKIWFITWKDDSFKGWILSIIFLFIFIKFIFFPVLSFTAGTALPLAIVESCSMYHEGNLFSNFGEWWDNNNNKYIPFTINEKTFNEFPMTNGFNKGDILLIWKAKPEELKEGDIIIFNGNYQHPLIHRIVDIKESDGKRTFSTLGDNNQGQIPVEKTISEDQLVGKAVFKLTPYLGWVKLIFFEWQKSDAEKGFCS